MLSVVVDNEKSKTIPERGLYKTNVECSNGTSGEWDYNAWNLTLENVSESAKCSITFTSNLTQAEYNTYINAGVALRRNTYRGKDISKYLTETGELNLYTQISSGRFNDIYVGDYIVDSNGIKWLIADLDNYMSMGSKPRVIKHHATIIPAKSLATAPMNATATTEGGYANSLMVTETLTNILETYITPIFGNHVLEYGTYLSSVVDPTTGVSTSWGTYTRKIDLMSEVNVFGTTIFSSSGYDVGIDSMQYAIFRLRPEHTNYQTPYWLKAVSNTTNFLCVDGFGQVLENYASAARANLVVPRFLIG